MTRSWPIREALTAKLKSLLEKRARRGEEGRGRTVWVAERQVRALNMSKRTNAVNVWQKLITTQREGNQTKIKERLRETIKVKRERSRVSGEGGRGIRYHRCISCSDLAILHLKNVNTHRAHQNNARLRQDPCNYLSRQYQCISLSRRPLHHRRIHWFYSQRLRGRAIHQDINPQNLHCVQWVRQTKCSGESHQR